MKWHIDTLLYDKPQYELIYTIDNSSNSVTEWIDDKGNKNQLWTEPNSLLIVKANGYNHNVTPVTIGTRHILKLIYTQSKKYNDNYLHELKRFNID